MARLTPLEATSSTTDRVYASLKDAITSLALRPGEAIVEVTIARQLGVSTTPVREALQRLAQAELVVLHRHRGATVRELTETDVREIYQLRETLEPLAAKLAVPVLSDTDLADMERSFRLASSAIARRDWGELSHVNRSFHGTFIRRCRNERMRRILEHLQDHNRIIALLTWDARGYDQLEYEEHLAILTAAKAGDADAAADLLRQHIVRFGRAASDTWSRHPMRSASAD